MSGGAPADGEARRFAAAAGDSGLRLDLFVARRLDQTRSRVQRWIREGRVTIDGAPALRPAQAVTAGETIECRLESSPLTAALEPQAGPLQVLWEDEHLVVVDKSPGVAVHPGAGRADRTLANFLLARYPEIAAVGHPRRPGIVHRLDLGTSGALAVARTAEAYRRLTSAFAAREVGKLYFAVVYGTPDPPCGSIDASIARDPRERKRMTAARAEAGRPRGRPALTLYRTLATRDGLSALELDLRTGRTHQIRVHLKSRGLPIVGDPIYGEARWRGFPPERRRRLRDFPRPALHAWRLTLPHPVTGDQIAVEAPIPPDLRELWHEITPQQLQPPGR
ncbi:MAG TPA: RluA family pseudouridine synthase [Thermoanaerobaculia bacterium]|nr:RluA family pseudouridine synthase [Thermoanaerobaculia bacterium]